MNTKRFRAITDDTLPNAYKMLRIEFNRKCVNRFRFADSTRTYADLP